MAVAMTSSPLPITKYLRALLAVPVLIGICTNQSRADEQAPDSHTIRVSVRAIQASEPHDSSSAGSTGNTDARAVRVDPALHDLESKLSHLPFNSFHLLSHKEQTITLKSRDSVQLPNGQSLMFRPIYMEAHKVGLWLNWKDRDGSEILNTRLHFDSQDSVLTGTDCSHNEGMILAIKAAQAQ